MGPDFPLQRIVSTSLGWEELQAREQPADCVTRMSNDPEYVAPESQVIQLMADYALEPGYCRHTE